MSPIRQPVGRFICFAVFGNDQKLLYSKYNFNFDLYISDKSISSDLSKNEVFNLFLDENETDVLLPFSVKSELEKYFLPITEEIQQYFDDFNYSLGDFEFTSVSSLPEREGQYVILENEFNLVYYDYFTQVQTMYEFLFIEETTNLIFTKYNFNFTEYSNDFRIYGSKMCVFSDFIFRYGLVETVTYQGIGSGYFGIPDMFRKYFYLDETSQNNLNLFFDNKYSIFSSFATEVQSAVNINFTDYKTLILDLYGVTLSNDTEAYKYFLKYGQFQQDPIKFNEKADEEINNLSRAVCSIITDNGYGTGILVWWEQALDREEGAVIVVTTYHTIAESNKNTFFANCYYNENTNLKLMFRIFAYDKLMDICMGIYDPSLDYNQSYFPDDVYHITTTLTPIIIEELFFNINQYKGQEITIIGNPQLLDYSKPLEGKIINPAYIGSFTDHFILSRPPTILSDINVSIGYSGSPVFTRDTDGILKWIGMVNAKTGDTNQFTVGIAGSIFRGAIGNGLVNYTNLVYPYYPDIDNRLVQLLIQDMYAKKWLGAVLSYYQPMVAENLNSAFRTFTYNGGLILHNFIVGFDTVNEVFLYDYEDLGSYGVTRLNTPLLGTTMYQKYLDSNKTPIVIKSIKMYDRIRRVYGDFVLGKYNGQVSFDIFTYCLTRNAVYLNSSEYVTRTRRVFPSITITYYYFNGKSWILNTETVGGNDETWYIEYTDNSGYKFLQHRFEFPKIFLQYLQPFSDTAEAYLGEEGYSDDMPTAQYSLSGSGYLPVAGGRQGVLSSTSLPAAAVRKPKPKLVTTTGPRRIQRAY
jgi:hypothetical protein